MRKVTEVAHYQFAERPSDPSRWGWFVFIFICLLATIILAAVSISKPKPSISVLKHELPPYHLITAADLTTKKVAAMPKKAVTTEKDLVGQYTQAEIAAETAVLATQLVSPTHSMVLTQTTAVSLPATAAMTYNGQLAAGSLVKLWTAETDGAAQLLLDNVLVLGVEKMEMGPSEGATAAVPVPYVLVVAVPMDAEVRVLTAVSAHGGLFVTKQ